MDLRQIKTGPDDFGLMTYDPAFMNTANCRSAITYIDGDKGDPALPRLPDRAAGRGERLPRDRLPDPLRRAAHRGSSSRPGRTRSPLHTMLHENIKKFMEGFRYDAHPMGIFLSTVGALSTFYPDAKNIFDESSRLLQTRRLIAKVPSIAAYAFRHSIGWPYDYPDNELSFTGNFLNMLFKMTEVKYQPNPVLARALDVLFILHADHEQNCSTTAMRTIGSSHVDPYSALAGAAAALYGPLHGGANEAVLRMLNEIGSVAKVPEFIKRVKSGEGHSRLMGFGHRVYKSYDPRAKVIKKIADLVFDGHRQEPAARDRARARADRAPGRLLRQPQALSERRLLLRPDLPGDGLPGRDVPGAVRHPADRGLDRAVGGNAARLRSRRSRGRGRSTSAPTQRDYVPRDKRP